MSIPIKEEDGLHKAWYVEARQQTEATLPEFIRRLSHDYIHDYGTICHAITASAIGAAHAVDRSENGGITGFQAGAVMWEFIRNWITEHKDKPLRIINFADMCYPQYAEKFACTISPQTWAFLQDEAAKLLAEQSHAHSAVRAHWQSIVEGIVPFGYTVTKEREQS